MQDLFELRLLLEPEAAALAARHAARQPDEVAALREFCQREEAGPEAETAPADWLTDHYRAHRRIAVMGGNVELERVLDEVLLKMERYHALDVTGQAPPSADAASTHRALVEAISADDSAAARTLTAVHVRVAHGRAVAAILDSEALRTVHLAALGPAAGQRPRESRVRTA
ncbi:FCD domain-containing protein [Lentzea kentuckyensis]|uniref:FCD domain-containing protein n=1 Tax=Lentzea kentuckyensis TaxID=360086 RepID=UPI000A3A0BCA|nr:FCD domain-containing protein [Lentzea kentuckyensis]